MSFSACVGGVKCGDDFGSSHLELAHKKFSRVVLLKKEGPLQYCPKGPYFIAVLLLCNIGPSISKSISNPCVPTTRSRCHGASLSLTVLSCHGQRNVYCHSSPQVETVSEL